jgi:hypothetical protein
MDVAHTILQEITHYMNDEISDFNYFFFKTDDFSTKKDSESKLLSRGEMGNLTQTKKVGGLVGRSKSNAPYL